MNHTEKTREAVRRLYLARSKLKEVEKELKEVEKKECLEISNYMYSNGVKSIEVLLDGGQGYEDFAMNPVLLRITKSKSKRINFIVDKIKDRFSKKIQKQVIKKKYEITDYDGLKKYLSSCGVDPKVFKKYITVTETVDKEAIDRLYSFGDISLESIKGCYDIKESKESMLIYKLKH